MILLSGLAPGGGARRGIERIPRSDDNAVMSTPRLSRGTRSFAAWIGAAALCLVSAQVPAQIGSDGTYTPTMEDVAPGIDHGGSDASLPPEFQKQAVFYRSQQPPGTIIIDTSERHLYLIEGPTRAIRYGIGVGRDGFTWQGLLQISRKAEWPDWHPPPK